MIREFVFTMVCGTEIFEARCEFPSFDVANAYAEKLVNAYASHGCSSVTVECPL
jgi:hypothetical protein